ncbi:MAG: epoxyqueuosine reductase QueH [Candidatus Moranbacteria bacterium]|nr:epoxyqueuosine reductase QueH [Candidatus Moranbacteria bacterium]
MSEKFLLHVCCAPCSIAVIDELRTQYDLSILFFNPNIHPKEEYLRRKHEVIRICKEWDIPMLDQDYSTEEWDFATKGLEEQPEGGFRCNACFRVRLSWTAQVAAEGGFSRFGSTLTTGRYKKAAIINPIGEAAANRFGSRFHAEDWKKKGREALSRRMVKDRAMYEQNYCGCRYSLRDMHRREERKKALQKEA